MSEVDIKQSLKVNVPADKAWEVIGPNFLNIQDWGRGINKSWKNETAQQQFSDAPAGGRYCDLGKLGVADEKIIHYDDSKREISWSAELDSIPGFVSNLHNNLSVTENEDGSSTISTNLKADLSGIRGFLLGGPIKKNFGKLLVGFVEDWKTYAETGEVSARKKKELERLNG